VVVDIDIGLRREVADRTALPASILANDGALIIHRKSHNVMSTRVGAELDKLVHPVHQLN